MSLTPEQQGWLNGYFDRMRAAANQPQPVLAPDGDIAQYTQQRNRYNSNPLVAIRQGTINQMAAEGIPTNHVQYNALLNSRFNQTVEAMKNGAISDVPFDPTNLVRLPNLQDLAANPQSAFNLLNPLSWLAPIGDVLGQIPFVRQLKAAGMELLAGLSSGQEFNLSKAWEAGVHMSLEGAFARLNNPALVEAAMADYQAHAAGTRPAPVQAPVAASNVDPNAPPGAIVPTQQTPIQPPRTLGQVPAHP